MTVPVLTPRAERQVIALRRHYVRKQRPEAIINLALALQEAWQTITADPAAGLVAPRPYKDDGIDRPWVAWVQAKRYWIAYRTRAPLAIVAVFHDAANIPGRL